MIFQRKEMSAVAKTQCNKFSSDAAANDRKRTNLIERKLNLK